MFAILKYIKLILWSGIYYSQEEKSDIVYKVIIKNIKESGCVLIKFIQWLLPKIEALYNINVNEPGNEWFLELEELYDNCNYHSIDYTREIYKKEFDRDIDKDYTINSLIASGSIGQVYRVTNKFTNEVQALKILHPDVDRDLSYLYYLLYILYKVPFISKQMKYYLPINIWDFINDFKIQINLINEANNCMYFYNKFKDDTIIIIPEVKKVSERILIMDYIEGESFDKCNISEYKKMECLLIYKSFIKCAQFSFGLIHGDLHKGNWKIRFTDEGTPNIIIYDYGLCFYYPNYLSDIDKISFIDRSMITPINSLKNFAKSCSLLINNKSNPDDILRNITEVEEEIIGGSNNTKQQVYDDPIFLMKVMLKSCRNDNYLIDSFALNAIIIHTQTTYYLERYGLVRKNRTEDYFERCILDVINVCETYNIFKDYKHILKEEYNKNKKVITLFESVEMDNPLLKGQKFKEMAIYKSD